MKIFIWGMGKTTEKFLQNANFRENIEIIGIIDGNNSCLQKVWKGYKIVKVQDIDKYYYDLIIVCSIYVDEIYDTICEWGRRRLSKVIFLEQNKKRNIWGKTLEYLKLKKVVVNPIELYKGEIVHKYIKKIIYGYIGGVVARILSINKNNYYICCPGGIGDTIFVAGLCHEYRKQLGKHRRIILILRDCQNLLPHYYTRDIDGKIVSDSLVNVLREYFEKIGINKKTIYYMGNL